jgi:hypothetical protein
MAGKEEEAAARKEREGKAAVELVAELQRLFVYMSLSNRKMVDPSGVMRALLDSSGKPVTVGNQEDVSEFNHLFLQRVQQGVKAAVLAQVCRSLLVVTCRDSSLLVVTDVGWLGVCDNSSYSNSNSSNSTSNVTDVGWLGVCDSSGRRRRRLLRRGLLMTGQQKELCMLVKKESYMPVKKQP